SWGEARPVRIGRSDASRLEDAVDRSTETLVVGGPVDRRGCVAAVVDGDTDQDMVDLGRDVLVDEPRREPGQGLAAPADGDLHLGIPRSRADEVDNVVGEIEAARGVPVGRRHRPAAFGRRHRRYPRTPTRTPRKRAGTDGWPVWPICWGWPLPQFGVPQKVHSSRLPSMSIEPQKRGLIAV